MAAAAAVMPLPLAVAAIAAFLVSGRLFVLGCQLLLVSGPPLFADVAPLLCLAESALPLFGNAVS